MTELYKKHRPVTLAGVVGQPEAIKVLERMIKEKKVPQFLLLTGPSGCGKTTVARILKKHLNCGDNDFTELDGAVNRGIDDMKLIRQQMRLYPMGGDCRIYLIDECHMLTREAQSALLKALEDTPSAVYFFLCTTDPEKLLPTIKTRASQIKLKAISHGEITKLVKTTAAHEKKKVTEDVLDKLTDAAAGSARKALVLLEQVLSLDDEDERLKFLENPDAQSEGIEIARALMNPRVTWPEVAKLIKQTTEEPETIRWIVLGYFNSVLLGGGKFAKRAAQVMNCFRDDYFQTKKAGLTLSCWEAVNNMG